jgi:predicted proteasome-type protease
METNIKKFLVGLDSVMLHNLSNSMPLKLQVVIDIKGAITKFGKNACFYEINEKNLLRASFLAEFSAIFR